jgi:hypothetical protein
MRLRRMCRDDQGQEPIKAIAGKAGEPRPLQPKLHHLCPPRPGGNDFFALIEGTRRDGKLRAIVPNGLWPFYAYDSCLRVSSQ